MMTMMVCAFFGSIKVIYIECGDVPEWCLKAWHTQYRDSLSCCKATFLPIPGSCPLLRKKSVFVLLHPYFSGFDLFCT